MEENLLCHGVSPKWSKAIATATVFLGLLGWPRDQLMVPILAFASQRALLAHQV